MDTADRISSRVIEAMDADEEASKEFKSGVGSIIGALEKVVDGVRQKVTFRRDIMVPSWVDGMRGRNTFDDLPIVKVPAKARGVVTMVMVDGRALVRLEDDHEVLARVGDDCKLLGRWYRFVDWLLGR